jgi:amino acid transporter
MKKVVLTFGLIAGAVLSAMMLLTIPFSDTIGFDKLEVIGYTTMVLAFLLVYFGVRSYRDSVGRGMISFGRAFAVGALIVAVASLCYVATWEVMYFNFTHDFLDKYQAHAVEKARAAGESQASIDQKRAEMEKFAVMYQNPVINAAMTFLEPLPVGLLIALISAGVLRRSKATDMNPGAVPNLRS